MFKTGMSRDVSSSWCESGKGPHGVLNAASSRYVRRTAVHAYVISIETTAAAADSHQQ